MHLWLTIWMLFALLCAAAALVQTFAMNIRVAKVMNEILPQ